MAETEQAERARYLVETYADQLLRLGYTLLGSVPDDQDVCQEVLLKALDRTQPFESRAHEKAWLLRVTVNACKNLRRSPWRTRTVSLEAVGEPAAFQPRAVRKRMGTLEVSRMRAQVLYPERPGIMTSRMTRSMPASSMASAASPFSACRTAYPSPLRRRSRSSRISASSSTMRMVALMVIPFVLSRIVLKIGYIDS